MRLFQKSLILSFLLLFVPLSAETARNEQINFSMVISGGVSLGAYESGYNWAMIKALGEIRHSPKWNINPVLRSVAGASAGSINALLTAAYWCQKESVPYQNTVEENLFYETWVNLGLENLIIKGNDPENKSTLFSRRTLQEKAENIMQYLEKPIFREGCEVPMGFAVTKVTPII